MKSRKKIISWLKKRCSESGAEGFVLGLSGGVDSSVVAALCREAVGRQRVLGLILPCHSHSRDDRDARAVARYLKIRTKTIDLGRVYDTMTAVLPKANRTARANLKPRMRMMLLYYFANKLNYLVCGTGNKTELMVGYFTKYGDGGVDLLPIGGLFKKDVVRLAGEYGIPEGIISKPPSAGLWQGQTDEGEMGMTYAELDDILMRMDKGTQQVASRAQLQKVQKMVAASSHKRLMAEIAKV